MCDPLTLTIAATAAAGVSSITGTVMAVQQANMKAGLAERNAAMERNAAQEEMTNTRTAALARYREIARLKGEQRVAAAANGVGLDFGTASDVVADTDMLGREDVGRIYKAGNNAVKSRDIAASNFMAEANMARSQKTGAIVGGVMDFSSTVLSGAAQYDKMKDAYRWQNVNRLSPSASSTIASNPGIF